MSSDLPRDLRLPPVLATVVYLSLMAAGWAFTSLILDQDVVVEKDAGPLLGPAMAVAGAAVVWVILWSLRNRSTIGLSLASAIVFVYFGMLAVGALGYGLSRGRPVEIVLFFARYATSPVVIVPALLAGATVLGFWFVGGRPLPDKAFDPPERTD